MELLTFRRFFCGSVYFPSIQTIIQTQYMGVGGGGGNRDKKEKYLITSFFFLSFHIYCEILFAASKKRLRLRLVLSKYA